MPELGKRLRAGVIGASGIGRMHVDGLRRIGVEVTAVAGSSPESAAAQARRLGVPRACEDGFALAADEEVDVVHVCTPNAQHEEQVLAAIEAGKHVVCEKPLTTSVESSRRLLAAAEAAGIVHGTAYTYRFFPAVTELRQAVAAGELGRVHLVRGAYLNQELLSLDPGHWLLDPERVGPALILADTGVHLWDMVAHVIGEPVEAVVATRQTARPAGGAGEDSATAMLRFPSGAVASIVVSGAAPGHSNLLEIEVLGTERGASWCQEDPDHLAIGGLDDRSERVMRRPDRSPAPDTLQLPPGHVHGYLDAFRDLMAAIYSAVPGGPFERPVAHPTFADGVAGIEVLSALLRSAASGEWVTVDRSS